MKLQGVLTEKEQDFLVEVSVCAERGSRSRGLNAGSHRSKLCCSIPGHQGHHMH